MGTVIIGFITSWVYSIAIFFVIQDVNAVISTPTKVPSLEVFRQALGGRIWGACLLQGLVTLCAIACVITVHTWQCRLVSFH